MKKFIIPSLLCILPLGYALSIFNTLPDIIPIHFNGQGEADGFGSKYFIFLGAAMPFIGWGTMIVVKSFDTKGKLVEMGNKFDWLTLGMILFMSFIGIILIKSMSGDVIHFELNYILYLIGGFHILMGNFMPTFKQNYLIGIRNPWTLENEEVWRRTHRLGGVFSILIGISYLIIGFIDIGKTNFTSIILILTFISAGVPTIYSYYLFKKILKK